MCVFNHYLISPQVIVVIIRVLCGDTFIYCMPQLLVKYWFYTYIHICTVYILSRYVYINSQYNSNTDMIYISKKFARKNKNCHFNSALSYDSFLYTNNL